MSASFYSGNDPSAVARRECQGCGEWDCRDLEPVSAMGDCLYCGWCRIKFEDEARLEEEAAAEDRAYEAECAKHAVSA